MGPYLLTNTKSNTLKLYHVTRDDFDEEGKADAKVVCSYAKLKHVMSSAATHGQHLLVGDKGGEVHLFDIPVKPWATSKNLKPSKNYYQHQSAIIACDISVTHMVTGEKKGMVNCWILGQDSPVWTLNNNESLFDLRFTPSNKVVIATDKGDLHIHLQVLDQGKTLFEQRYTYDYKCFNFAFADELKLNSMEHFIAVNFGEGDFGILDVSDLKKPTTTLMKHSYKISGESDPKKRLMFLSRDSFFCVLQKCKAKKNWRLMVCKNDSQDNVIEYPNKSL
jgi:WD40 repeat protein